MVTSEAAGVHTPFETVHLKTETPIPREVIVVMGEAGVVMTGDPGPLICVQKPVAGATGVFAAMVAEVIFEQKVWLGPALERGAALMVSVIVLLALVQGALAFAVRVRLTVPAVISAALGV
jgi:hypothetical protein